MSHCMFPDDSYQLIRHILEQVRYIQVMYASVQWLNPQQNSTGVVMNNWGMQIPGPSRGHDQKQGFPIV